MPRMPNPTIGYNQGGDFQAALAQGANVANQTARTVNESTQGYNQAANAMMGQNMENFRQRRELAFRRQQMQWQAAMGMAGMVGDMAFQGIGAAQTQQKLGQGQQTLDMAKQEKADNSALAGAIALRIAALEGAGAAAGADDVGAVGGAAEDPLEAENTPQVRLTE